MKAPVDTRGREPWWVYAYTAGALAIGIGMLGAAAFNPDDGFLVRSDPPWTVFGLAVYVGFVVICLLAVVGVIRLIFRLVRRVGAMRDAAG